MYSRCSVAQGASATVFMGKMKRTYIEVEQERQESSKGNGDEDVSHGKLPELDDPRSTATKASQYSIHAEGEIDSLGGRLEWFCDWKESDSCRGNMSRTILNPSAAFMSTVEVYPHVDKSSEENRSSRKGIIRKQVPHPQRYHPASASLSFMWPGMTHYRREEFLSSPKSRQRAQRGSRRRH